MNVTMADSDDVDIHTPGEMSLGGDTVCKHDNNILHDSVSGQAGVTRDDVQEIVKDGVSLRSWDCEPAASVETDKPDTQPCVPHASNCSVMLKEEEVDDCSDWGEGIETVTGIGDQFCSRQVRAVRYLEDTEKDERDLVRQKKDITEVVEATEGDVTEVFSQKEDIGEAAEAIEGDVTEVFSRKEDFQASEVTEGDVVEVFSQKEDVTEVVEATEDVTEVFSRKEDVTEVVEATEVVTEVFSRKDDIREVVEATEDVTEVVEATEDVTEVFSRKDNIREVVEATEEGMENMFCQKKEGGDILDNGCTQYANPDNIRIREADKLNGANRIHVAEVFPEAKVQVSCCEKVSHQNKNDDTVPGVCVWKEGVWPKEDISDFYEPTGENTVTEAAFVPSVCCRFSITGNHGKPEYSEEVSPLNKDAELSKDVQKCPRDPDSEDVPAISDVVGALSDQQGQGENVVAEERTVVVESHEYNDEHSVNTVKQILMNPSNCVLRTDQCVADQICDDRMVLCNTECCVKPITYDTDGDDGDDGAVGGEEATSTASTGNETDVADIAAPPGGLTDLPVVCGDSQPHFDLSDTFNIFAEDEHLDQFVTENNGQSVVSQDVSSVANVRQNAVSARAKKRKKEKAKLEKLLSRNTTSRAGRARRYAASFQELLANKEDMFHPDFTCPVCLDLYHKPHVVHPCQHMFCEPCLRKLPSSALADNAVCPLCRQDIRACVMDVDLHIQLCGYYNDIYTKRARQEKKLKTNQKPLPRIQTRPLSQQLIRHILSNQSNRRTDGNMLHVVVSVCLSAVLSVLYVWMNIPIEITSGRLRNAAVSNVWVQAICLFCALMWVFLKVLSKMATRERR